MADYSLSEIVDMVFIMPLIMNAREAARQYQDRYPDK